jgi:hypothetical protein
MWRGQVTPADLRFQLRLVASNAQTPSVDLLCLLMVSHTWPSGAGLAAVAIAAVGDCVVAVAPTFGVSATLCKCKYFFQKITFQSPNSFLLEICPLMILFSLSKKLNKP